MSKPLPTWRPSSAATSLDLSDIRTVIFDFDGVVADSEVLSLSTLHAALEEVGIELSQDDVRAAFLGRSLATISAYVAEHTLSQAADGFAETWQSKLFTQLKRSLRALPSCLALLEHLDRTGLDYCIASSSTFERIALSLHAMNLSNRFDHIFSAELVARGKPAPDLFLHAAASVGADPTTCLVVEDSPYGVKAAAAAGMRCAGFVGGTHLRGIEDRHSELLIQNGADIVIETQLALIDMGLSGHGSEPRRTT
ncbi:HAD family phosphatase [Gymnodinialimonas sp. 2305UL16-5]|uniref:HAD family hydrolase n=1 Tax=Gymnodinialimonas mytili TaxID=3126503 RepID=UPI0030ADA083